jgi:hypothetical protein
LLVPVGQPGLMTFTNRDKWPFFHKCTCMCLDMDINLSMQLSTVVEIPWICHVARFVDLPI